MKIIVCIKQVPDTNEVTIDPIKGTLIREGVPSIINPEDKNAIEEAIMIKESREDVHVTVISMGPPQAENALREALAMGSDEAILLSDKEFAGSDTWATSAILAAAINKIGDYDIIFCGTQSIDGYTAQVGPKIAEHLKLPQVTYLSNFKVNGNEVITHRAVEDGYYVIKSQMPVLLTVIKDLNTPRYPSIKGIYKAYREKEIKVWNINDIIIDRGNIGLSGSPTNVKSSFTPSAKFNGKILSGTTKEVINELIAKLREKQVI